MEAVQTSISANENNVSEYSKSTVKQMDLAQQSATATQIPCFEIPIDQIIPNPNQPRKNFNQDRLDGLAQSIREKGVIEPILVHKPNGIGFYELISGERRWRAAKSAGLKSIPAIVREDGPSLELAILENLQREDLNPIEEAKALKQLKELKGYTDEKLAKLLGISRANVSTILALLRLPKVILAECQHADNVSKTLLYHIVTQGDEQKMLEAWERYKAGKLSIVKAKTEKRKKSKRDENYVYEQKNPGYTLTIKFKRPDVGMAEVFEVLQRETDQVMKSTM